MKVLYLSCHSILEYDEVSMLAELGYDVFSLGAYSDPQNPSDNMRPASGVIPFQEDLYKEWRSYCDLYPGKDIRFFLSKFKKFVNKFDTIIIMHIPEWVEEVMKCVAGNPSKRVIWRTIGQSVASIEHRMQRSRNLGMEALRYSPREANIPGFCGQDGLIRFYKDPEVFKGWTGENKRVITFAQNMEERHEACNYHFFEDVTSIFPRTLFGSKSDHLSFGEGKVSFERQLEELRKNRVYFYTGTHPASYTLNFMESFMTGIPIVAIDAGHGNANYLRNHNLYEIPDLIKNGVNGFIGDNKDHLRRYIHELMRNESLAKTVSNNARKDAIKHFGREMIYGAWEAYLGK